LQQKERERQAARTAERDAEVRRRAAIQADLGLDGSP
jgi:hypothetical protein